MFKLWSDGIMQIVDRVPRCGVMEEMGPVRSLPGPNPRNVPDGCLVGSSRLTGQIPNGAVNAFCDPLLD